VELTLGDVDADAMTGMDEAGGYREDGSRQFESEIPCMDGAGQDQTVGISVVDSVRMLLQVPDAEPVSFTWRQALILNQQVTAAISVIVSSAMNDE
jgi:hypothetical protein